MTEKPTCEFCDKTFTRKSGVKKHYKYCYELKLIIYDLEESFNERYSELVLEQIERFRKLSQMPKFIK